MTSLQDCLDEVIEKGSGFVIRNSILTGEQRTAEWEPAALLSHLQRTSPGMLEDHAWMEWHLLRTTGTVGYIHYGAFGSSMAHMGVPGYGRLSVLAHAEPSLARMGDDLFARSSASDGY